MEEDRRSRHPGLVESRRNVLPLYLLLILLIPFEVQATLSKSLFGFTIIKWIGLLAVVIALLNNIKTQRGARLAQSVQGKFFLMLLVLVLLSWSLEGYWHFTSHLQVFISFAVFFFVTLSLVNTVDKARLVIWAVVIGMFLASLDVITDYRWMYMTYGNAIRPGGLFKDPNYFAISVIMALPFAYYLLKTSTREILRFILYGILVLDSVALVLSLSRGAFVGLAGMILIAVLLSKKKTRTSIILGAIILVTMAFAPDRLWNRISETRISQDEPVYGTAASTTRRWHLLSAGLKMVAAKPIQGVGLGKFKSNSIHYEPILGYPGVAHNTYIEFVAELGIPALLLFIGLIFYAYRDLLQIRQRFKDDPDLWLLSTALIVSLTGFVIAGAFVSGGNTKIFWLIIFLTIALKRCLIPVVDLRQEEVQHNVSARYGSIS